MPEPQIASSAAEAGYAESFPAELQGLANGFGANEVAAKKTIDEMPGYADQLKDPISPHVVDVVDAADDAGRSYAYVERVRDVQGAMHFFDAQGEEITKKAAGAGQYAVKQKECEVDVYGPVAHGLKEGVDKQLEKHLRERSEAHRTIERNGTSLGKENIDTLEKQADAITYASYLIHIEMVEQKVRMQRILGEVSAVKSTTDDAIAAERAAQAEAGKTAAEKKASEARIEAMQKSKASLDSAVTQAQSASDNMDARIKALDEQYKKALDALKSKLESKAKK